MTRTIKAHFDGKVLVPDEPVDLPVGEPLELRVTDGGDAPLVEDLLRLAGRHPPDPASPGDGTAQHDHHLYGTPRRDQP